MLLVMRNGSDIVGYKLCGSRESWKIVRDDVILWDDSGLRTRVEIACQQLIVAEAEE
jgi:hypothetical protein